LLEYLKYAGILFGLIILQLGINWLLPVTSYKITPDVTLIGIVYVSINRGKIIGSVSGFFSGLVLDLISFSFLGLSTLSKASAGFFAGFFFRESKINKYLSTYIFVLIVLFASLVNNFFYYVLYYQGSSLQIIDIVLRYILPTSIYTSFISVIPLMFFRKRLFKR